MVMQEPPLQDCTELQGGERLGAQIHWPICSQPRCRACPSAAPYLIRQRNLPLSISHAQICTLSCCAETTTGTQLTERELFMRTLVCNVDPGVRPLACGAAEQLLRARTSTGARRAAQLTSTAESLQVTSAPFYYCAENSVV